MHKSAKRPVKIAKRTFEILERVEAKTNCTAEEIANEMGLGKTTVRRYLLTLADEGYLVNEGASYRISHKFLRFVSQARKHDPLFQLVKPKVDSLAEETGEVVWYQTEENGLGVRVYRERGEQAINTGMYPGTTYNLHQSSAGKAMLSCFSDEIVNEIVEKYGLPTRTSKTLGDADALFAELEEIREKGFAVNREETVEGLHAVGVPIQDENKQPLGAISVSGPANRLSIDVMENELSNLLLGVANEIELSLSVDF